MRDMHSHILYGLDDGAGTLDDSLAMLKAAAGAGVTEVTATPHVRSRGFKREIAKERLKELQTSFGRISLCLGYELHCNVLAQCGLDCALDYCTEGTRELLLEFDPLVLPVNLERIIYRLQNRGILVRVAHPERYADIQKDPSIAQRLSEMGCELQISAGSLLDYPWSSRKICALKLIKAKIPCLLASDAHAPEDYGALYKALKRYNDRINCIK